MKKKINKHLHEEEDILFISMPSWWKYWHSILLSPLVIPLVFAIAKKYSTHFVVTNKRVLIREGIMGERTKSVSFPNLTTVKAHQSIRGKIFNYGYLHVHTHTGGHADLVFHYIKNPIKVKKEIERGIERYESKGDKARFS